MMYELGAEVAWTLTASGQACQPKPCVVVEVTKNEYAYRVRGKNFDCYVPARELRPRLAGAVASTPGPSFRLRD